MRTCQSAGSSGRCPDFEDLLAHPISGVAPAHDGAGLAIHPARDCVERQAFIEQGESSSSPRGQHFRRSFGSHSFLQRTYYCIIYAAVNNS